MATCLRCKKVLTDPVSIKRGYGPECWGKSLTEGGQAELITDQYYDIPFDVATCDVICKRVGEWEKHFNISQTHIKHSPTGMEWGYSGSGPADFALNILCRFTSAKEAATCYQEFKALYVAALPKEGGIIEGDKIRSFLRSKGIEPII